MDEPRRAVPPAAGLLGGPDLAAQLLVYPAVDARMSHASITENGDGYLLTKTISIDPSQELPREILESAEPHAAHV